VKKNNFKIVLTYLYQEKTLEMSKELSYQESLPNNLAKLQKEGIWDIKDKI